MLLTHHDYSYYTTATKTMMHHDLRLDEIHWFKCFKRFSIKYAPLIHDIIVFKNFKESIFQTTFFVQLPTINFSVEEFYTTFSDLYRFIRLLGPSHLNTEGAYIGKIIVQIVWIRQYKYIIVLR